MAPAGTDWVLGYAAQATLAGADDVDGSLGLEQAQHGDSGLGGTEGTSTVQVY